MHRCPNATAVNLSEVSLPLLDYHILLLPCASHLLELDLSNSGILDKSVQVFFFLSMSEGKNPCHCWKSMLKKHVKGQRSVHAQQVHVWQRPEADACARDTKMESLVSCETALHAIVLLFLLQLLNSWCLTVLHFSCAMQSNTWGNSDNLTATLSVSVLAGTGQFLTGKFLCPSQLFLMSAGVVYILSSTAT